MDGFITGPDLDRWPGLGRGGTRLHAWLEHQHRPLLLGSGTALFDGAGPELERLDTVDSSEATHVTYRVGQVTP